MTKRKNGTQDSRVLEWLLEGKELNPLEAWVNLGTYRLAAVIHRLRQDGYDIETGKKKVKNRYDEECEVANYYLIFHGTQGEMF